MKQQYGFQCALFAVLVGLIGFTAGCGGSGGSSGPPPNPGPLAPFGLMAVPGNAKVMLSWSASAGATSYTIVRSVTSSGLPPAVIASNVIPTTFTDTNVTNGTNYSYQVAGVNDKGTGPLTSVVTATPTSTAPPPPIGLSALSGDRQITLSWSLSPGATGYNVFRGTAAGGEGATPIATNVPRTSFVDTGLTNGVNYFYNVVAVNPIGASAPSNEATATPMIATFVPTPPFGVTASAGASQVTLNWIGSRGATSYNIFRGTSSGGEGSTPIQTGVTSTTFTDTGLTNGVTYFYQVTAVNPIGSSGRSNEASAAPAASPPAAPTNLTASAGPGLVAVSWTASSTATSYNLFRTTISGLEGGIPIQTGITSTSFTDTNVVNGVTYFYKVAGVNGKGMGPFSNEANATPFELVVPDPPTGLVAFSTSTIPNPRVNLTWNPSARTQNYTVLRSINSGSGFTKIGSGVTVTSFSDATVSHGIIYVYVVTANNLAGSSDFSNEASASP